MKYDKDFLGKCCDTPDCGGMVLEIRVVRESLEEKILKYSEEEHGGTKKEDVKKIKGKQPAPPPQPPQGESEDKLPRKHQKGKTATEGGKVSKKEKKLNEAPNTPATCDNTDNDAAATAEGEAKSQNACPEPPINTDGADLTEQIIRQQNQLISDQAKQIDNFQKNMHDMLLKIEDGRNHSKRQAEVISIVMNCQ